MVALTEKYRPRTLDEIKGNREVLDCLKSFTVEAMPNMLFHGPPGTGKTTAIRALVRNHSPRNVLELNASDERGIETVRTRIKEFSQMKLPGIKVVVLDEADSMSRDAQNAMRRIMEDFPDTRFCLICNYFRKIIEPIASRCTKFHFSPVDATARVIEVCRAEGIPCDESGAVLLNEYSGGDMRKVLNDVDGLRSSYGAVTRQNILEFFHICDSDVFDEIYTAFVTMSFDECRERVVKEDVECAGLLPAVTARLLQSDLPGKLRMCTALSEIEYHLSLGCTDDIQLQAIIGLFVLNRAC